MQAYSQRTKYYEKVTKKIDGNKRPRLAGV